MSKRTAEHNAAISAALRARGAGESPTKICPRCKRELPREEFGERSVGYSKSYCRPCDRSLTAERARRYREAHPEHREELQLANKRAQFKRKYGITWERFEQMRDAQGGVCAICGGEPRAGRLHLSVDHSHGTGAVRGLLCDPCNQGIGLFRDSPELLESAVEYLRRTR